jgi:hypothetical protein
MDDLRAFPEDTGGEECGRALAGLLADEIVPTMRPLLDRAETARRGGGPFGAAVQRVRSDVTEGTQRDPAAGRRGTLAAVEEALCIVEAQDPEDMVAVWARQAQRAAAGS